jgi:UDP-N-acetylglucosamine--N-acetylmuramyl-(pentapeptide) pyrophosphoryl-undecaprenol N-acetylglucosamine transferase
LTSKNILLAAGGTGGHLFPAEALAHELITRGYKLHLATDARAERFAANFPAETKTVITSATLGSKNPVAVVRMALRIFQGYRQSSQLLARINPGAVIGFGGYPSLPPLIAAERRGIPTLVHEQNAILGRANRFLARRARAIAVGFAQIGKKPSAPIVLTGNPVRPMVDAVTGRAYPGRKAGDVFQLVIFGGSQGARVFSEILPPALALLSTELRSRLMIVQQAREEDEAGLRQAYVELGVRSEIAPFFANMPEEISKAHFVIARAGASSVTELAVIGRPSLLVPLPGSLDGDQAANAISMAGANGAFVVKQAELTAGRLAEILENAITHPDEMAEMAMAARSTGMPDAAKRLADLVECVISGGDITKLQKAEKHP